MLVFPEKLLRTVKILFPLVSSVSWSWASIEHTSPGPIESTTARRWEASSFPWACSLAMQPSNSYGPTPSNVILHTQHRSHRHTQWLLKEPWVPASQASAELLGQSMWEKVSSEIWALSATWNLLHPLIPFLCPWLSGGAASCSCQLWYSLAAFLAFQNYSFNQLSTLK